MAKKSRGFDYFEEFHKLSQLCVDISEILVEAVDNWTTASAIIPQLEKAHEIENQGDIINHGIYEAAATDFVTPIERDDILEMAQSLDNVIDDIEDVMKEFYMYDARFMAAGTQDFARLIHKSCVALEKALQDFRDFKKSKTFRESMMAINECEEEGDRVYLKVVRDLHTLEGNDQQPMRVMVWSRIFRGMEGCCDACEHVADTMSTVMLRNS